MNKVNYDAKMKEIISEFQRRGEKPSLLMHACCAPCASACVERVREFFDLTVYFYNPNMDSVEEYEKRAEELKRFCGAVGVKYIVEDYHNSEYIKEVCGLEKEKEGGKRCEKCFSLRLTKTASKAKELGQKYFTTTLTVSPLKNSQLINETGFKVSESTGVEFLPSDFKKNGGYVRSVELSGKYGLYRQNYCGCVFSKREDGGAK